MPNLVKTRIDKVVKPEFDRELEPEEVLATNGIFFKQDTIDRNAITIEEYSGVGAFTAHNELETIEEATVRAANLTTYTVKEIKRKLRLSREFWRDDLHSTSQLSMQQFGVRARTSRDKIAFADTYGDAFSGTVTPDAAALISNSHTNLKGDTIDNLETGALTVANLITVIRKLRIQKAQDGEVGAHNPVGLLVPPALWDDAVVITESELKSGSTDNDTNFLSNKYPGMTVGTSVFLDSAYNSINTNTDTSYFVVGRFHGVKRWVREGLNSDLLLPSMIEGDEYVYKARFAEMTGATKWEGILGSNGTT